MQKKEECHTDFTKYSCKDIIKAIKLLWEVSYKILVIPAKI